MKDGKCPKCGSTEVYSSADVYPKTGPFTSNTIPISLTSMAPLDNYVCTECGLVQSYVADPRKLEEIARKWSHVVEENDT